MAEVIGPVLAKIGWSLAQQVISTLSKEFSIVKDLTWRVRKIRTELNVMNDLLLQFGYHNVGRQDQCKEWIGEVRKLAYSVEDVMDKYSYHALEWAGEGRVNKMIKSSKYVSTWQGLSEDIARIESELKNISTIRQRWVLELPSIAPSDAQEQRTQRGCFNGFVEDIHLVGMDEKRDELVTWLNSNEKASKVLIASGIGGLGKTNLVWNVYEKQRTENHFDAYAWTGLSENYNAGDFLRDLIQQLNGIVGSENNGSSELDSISHIKLRKELEKAVEDKKCMVILDDVWDDGPYNEIHDIFQTHQSASRIIITTRRRDGLAARALVRHRLVFEPLDDLDARNLFCRNSPLEIADYSQGFSEVAEAVTKTCGNHPLAIIAIARKLSDVPLTEIDWQVACNEPRSLLSEDPVLRVLHRNYNNLDKDMRNCFLYCSLFPEGYPIRRECIIRMWVAEGLVMQRERNTAETVAEGYMRKMIDHNMIRPVDRNEFGEVVTCKLDPILRILALSISEEIQFGVANDQCRMEQSGDSVRRLSACRARDRHAPDTKCPHLRTLIAVGAYTAPPDKLCWISEETMYLAVLELQDSSIDILPPSVGNLFNLRYLGLRSCTKVKSLPKSIKKLINLETLDLKSTSIEKLPGGIIRKLNRLKHLFADRFSDQTGPGPIFSEGVAVPKGLPCLLHLQTLETIQANSDLGKQLEKLEQLTSLSIDNLKASHCKDLFPTLFKKSYLSSLLLSANDLKEKLCLENVEITSMELQKLVIRGCLAEGILQNFIFPCQKNKLKYLNLTSCKFEDDPLHLLAEHLPELTCLSLKDVECKTHLELPKGKFKFLNTLVLKGMTNLQHLTICDGAIPKVEALVFETMPNLKKVPPDFNSLCALKKLWLLGMTSEFRTDWHDEGWQKRLSGILDIRVEE